LFWKHSSVFLPYYLWDAPSNIIRQAHEIRRAFGLFSDSESRRLLLSHVSLQLTGDFSVAPRPSASGRYFPEGLYEPSIAECFVDCGAYNGDTVREFTAWSRGQFRRIIAFEPDPVSFAALERCVFEDLKLGARVVTKRCATGRAAARVLFSASASEEAAVSNEGSLEVDCVTLDQALADERPTLIKMDIEGAELETIEGAQQVIRRDQPIMVVCLYHRQSDLWRIPLMIRELEPNSRLYLRQHEADGWELVCYSVPEWRLRRE
jgi:FkbM family methyltransferase